MKRANKGIALVAMIALGIALSTRPVIADLINASSKAAIKVGTLNLVTGPQTAGSTAGPWTTIMSTTIKTAAGKDLVICPSLECGLYTATTVNSKNGVQDTSSSKATIQVQVLVDGQPAHPGAVVYSSRSQTLSATLQGILNSALSVDPTTGQVTIDPTLLTPEQISLVLETTSANSFNFAASVGSGLHTIQVQTRIDLGVTYQTGSAIAQATIGQGSLTVETVRLVGKGTEMDF
jgi:hypothetical protein